MDNLQAALLNIKIQHIDEILERRKQIANRYLAQLHGVVEIANKNSLNWQDFIVNCGIDRDNVYEFLKEQGVETMKNEYPFSTAYPKLPLAAKYEAETLRLPCNENLTNKEVEYVIEKVKKFYG